MNYKIHPESSQGEISSLWFGHNLEPTRSCIWQGLSGQLIRNRKFAGLPQRLSGVAQEWYRVGPRESWHLLEVGGIWPGFGGHGGTPYTAHFDRELLAKENTRQCQRIELMVTGVPCGVGQAGLTLIEEEAYDGRLVLRSDRDIEVSVQLVSESTGQVWWESSVAVHAGDWQACEFCFTAAAAGTGSRLEVTFESIGVLCIGAVSLLPAENFHGMRVDVVELLKEISVPILRWPGGNFADDYHWKDGLLPVDQRVPVRSHMNETLPHTHDYDMHEIGTDEFIALCREIGAEPFITVNLGREGTAEAAAWVEYCNGSTDTDWGRIRAERGHPESYGVTQWSLGNEYGYGHMLGPNKPGDYAEAAAECAEAMRNVDPSLEFTVTGTYWEESWHKDVLGTIGEKIKNIAFHHYTPLMKHFTGDEGNQEFRRVVSDPDRVFETLTDIRRTMQRYSPENRQIGISFDEWNVWYAWYRRVGVAEGIFAASMVHNLCRDSRRLGVTIGAFFEPVNEGAIWVEPDGAQLTAVGQVFAALKPHQNRQLVDVTQSAIDSADIDVVASLDEDAGELFISIVNQSPIQGSDIEMNVPMDWDLACAEGFLLSSTDFLPGSRFGEAPLGLRSVGEAMIQLSLPKHSIAMLRIEKTATDR